MSGKPLENTDFSGERTLGRSEPGRYQQSSLRDSWPSCCRQKHFLAQNDGSCYPWFYSRQFTLFRADHKLCWYCWFVLQAGRSLCLQAVAENQDQLVFNVYLRFLWIPPPPSAWGRGPTSPVEWRTSVCPTTWLCRPCWPWRTPRESCSVST